MGVNFPDVRYVINWVPQRTLIAYHQEAGRAGRDGKQAHSIIIYHGNQAAHCEHDIKQLVCAEGCYRVASLKPFFPRLCQLNLLVTLAEIAFTIASAMIAAQCRFACLKRNLKLTKKHLSNQG